MHNNTAGPVISTTINNMLMDHAANSATKSNNSASRPPNLNLNFEATMSGAASASG